MTIELVEIMPELFTRSEMLIWNFSEITEKDRNKNIQQFMEDQERLGNDPRKAFHRQEFNNSILAKSGSRYLIGRYGEDRKDILRGSHLAKEGRTYHLAIDIFSQDQESIFSPCDGEIVRSEYEPGQHNYGNYLILLPNDESLPYIFFGHLAADKHGLGYVQAGQQIGRLGTFEGEENGGWSIHLHLQLLTELPPLGHAPIGYSSLENLPSNKELFPDPAQLFPQWQIKR